METLPTTIATAAAADQAVWAEIYDFYLHSAITTPWGSASVLRMASAGGDVAFFTPLEDPEPAGTQGDAATYRYWPIKRQLIKSQSKFANDKLALAVSNVTGEFAQMLADVDWYDVPVVVRKVAVVAGLTSADSVVIFHGQIDSARVTLEQIQFTLSSNLATFQTVLPQENMHAACRFRFGDDMCTAIPLAVANYRAKYATVGGSTTKILAESTRYEAEPVTADNTTGLFTLTGHTLVAGDRVTFGGTAAPTGITAGAFYYVYGPSGDTFQVEEERAGGPVSFSDDGTDVTLTSIGGIFEDTIASAGTDLVNALADGAITTSSEQTGSEGYRVKTGHAAGEYWAFGNNPSNPTPSVDIYTPWIRFDFGSGQLVQIIDLDAQALARVVKVEASADDTTWVVMTSVGPALQRNNAGQSVWRIAVQTASYRYWRLTCSKAGGQAWHDGENIANTIVAITSAAGSDLVNPLADGAITTSDEVTGHEGYRVQTGYGAGWQVTAPSAESFGVFDWGVNLNGYWQIPDAQAGLKNAALTPYIQFDFGSAVAPGLWTIKQRDSVDRSLLPRLIEIFSSTNASDWVFQTYFELPATAGATAEINIPGAASARYWRICVRTIWGDQFTYGMFNKVTAHAGHRNYWAAGTVKFDAATTTAALRGIARAVLKSEAGALYVPTLPAAPQLGDTFVVKRGCARTFNACAEKQNTENYGGFDSLPSETIVR